MNAKTVEALLPCYREGVANDPRVEKAARFAAADNALREKLEQQNAWDAQVCSVLGSIQAPPGLRRKIVAATTTGAPQPATSLRQLGQPAILAVICGLLVIAGLLVYFEMDRREAFRGRDAAAQMIDVTSEMSGFEMEPMTGDVWRLGDWFYMRGFEGFAVPPEVASLPVVGARVFRMEGGSVAQLAVETQHSILFVFRAADFGVESTEGKWTVFDHEGWAAAIKRQGATCTMIALRGSKSQMRDFVSALGKKQRRP